MNKIFLWLVIGVIMVAPIGSTGTPDYGKSLASNPTVQSYDAGEDTTRLLMGGGANSRSGRWSWATGFESGLGELQVQAYGGGLTPTIDTQTVYMGKQSLKITGVAAIGAGGLFYKYLFSPAMPQAPSSRFGLEGMVAIAIANSASRVNWRITTAIPNTAPQQYATYQIRLEILANNSGSLYYRDNAGLFVLIANVNDFLIDTAGLFHYSKLVVDVNTGMYVKFIFDNAVYPLENISAQRTAGNFPYIENMISWERRTAVANASNAWIDNVVITGDEP